MKKSVEGNEFPDLDIQPTSTAHNDRYKSNSQISKKVVNSQNIEKKSAKKS